MKFKEKWKDMRDITKRWFVFLVIICAVIVGVIGYYSVKAIVNYNPYRNYRFYEEDLAGKFELKDFILAVGESADYDLDWELRDVGFKIKKIKFDSQGGLTYRDKKLTATRIGPLNLKITLYSADKKEIHTITVARAHGYTSSASDEYIRDAVEIRTARELADINKDLSGKYILCNNIDLSGFGEWTPIGYGNYFTGSLVNPYGYKITNLRITSDISCAGLFDTIDSNSNKKYAYVDGLILKNVFIDNSRRENFSIAGGITGCAGTNSIIHNCTVTGTITSLSEAGGIAGEACNATISGCIFLGNVKVTRERGKGDSVAGGIVGYIYSERMDILNCVAGCDVDAQSWAGGIIGYMSRGIRLIKKNIFGGTLLNASNKGEIYGNESN